MEINLEEYGGPYKLSLYDNPIESPPKEIIKQGRKAVLDWFEATKRKLNEIKIILIGDPKAGKTSLLRKLKDDVFKENEPQTDGINIEHIAFGECPAFKEQRSLHKLTGHFWDFGGQEIMNATHQFFLTNRSVYILVLNARKDTNISAQIRHWVKRIKATGGNSPVIVVANQADLNQGFGFSNEYELQQEFPQIKYFIKASCNTGENIDLIKEKLEELIPRAELFNTAVDERWIGIMKQLQEETKSNHFLDETRFKKICGAHKLNDKDGRKNAITFFHDLGLVLHFEELHLSEYYVLDPYWITYGVYQIVTSSLAGKQKGVVSMKDELDFIVNEEEDKKEIYRPANYRKIQYKSSALCFLVDILHQFKLSFYLPDRRHFIIPDLLDTIEPHEITGQIRNSDNSIRFVYEYEYLPKSIMPQIMVEKHNIIQKMWRTGCILENNDDCKALVSNYQNRIFIIVAGEYKTKREFMAVIRHLIDSINQKLSDKPKMLIPLPDIDEYADYEVLLEMEKDGVKDYTLYKPAKKKYPISELLEGVPTEDEIREINKKLDKVLTNQEELSRKFENDLMDAIKEMNAKQSEEITGEIMQWIAASFGHFEGDMDKKLHEIYTDLKKTDDVQMKLKLAVPFIKLLGVDFEAEVDVKSWATKMYEKHKLKIFNLMVPL